MSNTYLLMALFFCHFLADYTQLSRPWMLKAKATGQIGWQIMAHAFVHGFLMAVVLGVYCADTRMSLLLFQIMTHFCIDVLKGRMNVWFPKVKDSAKYPHWILFGFDQFLHAVVIIIMASIATEKHLPHL